MRALYSTIEFLGNLITSIESFDLSSSRLNTNILTPINFLSQGIHSIHDDKYKNKLKNFHFLQEFICGLPLQIDKEYEYCESNKNKFKKYSY